jgi:hypothetical protein
MSGCFIGCYYYTDSCFRKDCKMNEFDEFNKLVNEYNEACKSPPPCSLTLVVDNCRYLDPFAPDQTGMSVQGLSNKKFIGSGEDVVLGDE